MEVMTMTLELASVTRCAFGVERHCLGAQCMAWVWQSREDGDHRKGHCARVVGLIQQPEKRET